MSDVRLKSSTCLSKHFYQRRNTLPKAKSKPSFVIVNVHQSIQENEVREELLNNNAMNMIKVLRITSRATEKPTKLIRVITDSSNHVTAAVKNGVKISWVLHRCRASKEPPHIKCQKFGHSASDCKHELRCLRCAGKRTAKLAMNKKNGQNVQTLVVHNQQCIGAVSLIRTQ